MFSDKKYDDYRLALGELLVNGIVPKVIRDDNPLKCGIVNSENGEQIAGLFRDGSGYKVKVEKVQDYIDDHKQNAA